MRSQDDHIITLASKEGRQCQFLCLLIIQISFSAIAFSVSPVSLYVVQISIG